MAMICLALQRKWVKMIFFSSKHLVIRSVFIPIPKKGNDKEYSSCCTIALISHTSKMMLKILQVHMNCELPDIQAGFRKGRGTRDQIANISCITEKARELQKNHLPLLY